MAKVKSKVKMDYECLLFTIIIKLRFRHYASQYFLQLRSKDEASNCFHASHARKFHFCI